MDGRRQFAQPYRRRAAPAISQMLVLTGTLGLEGSARFAPADPRPSRVRTSMASPRVGPPQLLRRTGHSGRVTTTGSTKGFDGECARVDLLGQPNPKTDMLLSAKFGT